MRSWPVVVAALASLACSGDPAPAGPPTPPAPHAGEIALSIVDLPVQDAVTDIAARTHRTVVVDPAAASFARCARISVVTPGAVPEADVLSTLGAALRGAGFTVDAPAGTLHIGHDASTVPSGCLPPGVAEPAPSPATTTGATEGVTDPWHGPAVPAPSGTPGDGVHDPWAGSGAPPPSPPPVGGADGVDDPWAH